MRHTSCPDIAQTLSAHTTMKNYERRVKIAVVTHSSVSKTAWGAQGFPISSSHFITLAEMCHIIMQCIAIFADSVDLGSGSIH